MAQTTMVRIGAMEFPISGPAAEKLDEYNVDNNTFSPEDLQAGGGPKGFPAGDSDPRRCYFSLRSFITEED